MNLDTDIFFNTNEFAKQMTYYPQNAQLKQVIGVVEFKDDYHSDSRGFSSEAILYLKEQDVQDIQYNDEIEIDAQIWQIVRVLRKDLGVILLQIRR